MDYGSSCTVHLCALPPVLSVRKPCAREEKEREPRSLSRIIRIFRYGRGAQGPLLNYIDSYCTLLPDFKVNNGMHLLVKNTNLDTGTQGQQARFILAWMSNAARVRFDDVRSL